ncbi:MAG: 3-dehydroquinate synthase [Candidatus Saganbacteria bacterium]|nr:3-dehydroquinate synthase [Candidatus Saganbacteria bacterium]
MNSNLLKRIPIDFDGSSYEISLGRGIIGETGAMLAQKTKNRQVLVLYDAFLEKTIQSKLVSGLKAAGFEVFEHALPGGKINKNINEALKIFGVLESNDFSRDSTLIAVGGGVVGDLGGFVASTYLRGINLVQVPTTLMAMLDSSIGGKVAVNFRKTINAIGNYYHPVMNIIDLDFVTTLPFRDYKAGLAEAIKCAIISDRGFFDYLRDNTGQVMARSDEHLLNVLSRSIGIKVDHVKGDVKEGGKRLKLNYGHTLGHAIEISTENGQGETFRHGEGVAIGIMAAAYIARAYLKQAEDIYLAQNDILKSYELPVLVESARIGFDRAELIEECLKNVNKDKKRKDNRIRLVLSQAIGQSSVYPDVPFALIQEAFDHIIKE